MTPLYILDHALVRKYEGRADVWNHISSWVVSQLMRRTTKLRKSVWTQSSLVKATFQTCRVDSFCKDPSVNPRKISIDISGALNLYIAVRWAIMHARAGVQRLCCRVPRGPPWAARGRFISAAEPPRTACDTSPPITTIAEVPMPLLIDR